MFWGLILEPKKRYSQVVSKAFHVSNAALDVSTGDSSVCQVLVTYNGSNFLLCTLQKEQTIQTPLDLCFKEGDKISFISNGNCYVHLTGYLNPDYDFEDMEEEEDEEAEEGASEDEEVPQLEAASKKKRKLEETSPGSSKKAKEENKKNKNGKAKVVQVEDSDDDDSDSETDIKKLLEGSLSDTPDDSYLPNESKDVNADSEDDDDEDDDDDDDDDEEEEDDDVEVATDDDDAESEEEVDEEKEKKATTKKNKKEEKLAKQNGHAEKKDKVVPQQKEKKQKEPETKQVQKRVLAGNVVVEDIRVGQGAVAKSGKMVQVFYEGRLMSNNKMFDSCSKNPGFKFRLGKKEVISGWDVGIVGMKVGGKRKITCPPGMAYGTKGSPPVIPSNSTLVFEVELKGVN